MNAKKKVSIQIIALLVIIPPLLGFVSLKLGKDQNWDLRNYHYYNAYAFINNRIQWDILPGQRQTYINPLLDIPFYWMTEWIPAKAIGFIMGAIHGLNVILVFLIYWRSIEMKSLLSKYLLGLFLTAISAFAPGFLSEVGTTFNDNLVGIFIFTALLILILASKSLHSSYLVALAGFVMGMGVGLKENVIIYAIGAGIALPILFNDWHARVKVLLLFGICGIVGVAATTAVWSWRLWITFGNPILPFYNNVFHSPYVLIANYIDTRFLPRSILEYVFWPFIFTTNTFRVSEIKFSDVRFTVLYALVLSAGIKLLLNMMRGKLRPLARTNGIFGVQQGAFLFIFFLFSFILWMKMFSIYRYIIVLELLVPICAAIVLERIVSSGWVRMAMGIVLVILVVIKYSPLSWGRGGWSDPYLFVDTSSLDRNEKSVVIMLGYSPISYAIPFFPTGMRFVRPEGNLDLNGQTQFIKEIQDLLNGSLDQNFFVLYDLAEKVNPVESISKLGINGKMGECYSLQANIPDKLDLCLFSHQ